MNAEMFQAIALDIVRGRATDDRPDWLKAMPSAMDNTAYYYPFFYQLCKRHGPFKMLEIGTYLGSSCAHMAVGNGNGGEVVTIDINPGSAEVVAKLGLGSRITTITSESTAAKNLVKPWAPYDILFIDGHHGFSSAWMEYELYRPLVRDGGAIFFDDISLDMATKEMQVLWEMIPDPKHRLDMLHYTGFGVAIKDQRIEPKGLGEISAAATERMRGLGGVL